MHNSLLHITTAALYSKVSRHSVERGDGVFLFILLPHCVIIHGDLDPLDLSVDRSNQLSVVQVEYHPYIAQLCPFPFSRITVYLTPTISPSFFVSLLPPRRLWHNSCVHQ